MISILLAADLIAIVILSAARRGLGRDADDRGRAAAARPAAAVFAAWALERYLYYPLIRKFDRSASTSS